MNVTFVRRRKLGRGSTNGLVAHINNAGHRATVVRNDLADRRGYPNSDLYVRWGCTANIPGGRVLNTAQAIHEVNDKTSFRAKLQREGEDLVPQTWFNMSEDITYPVIVRPRRHHQGRRLYVCQNRTELTAAVRRCGEGYYISKLINKAAEYRVFVCQGRIASVARKTPGNTDQVAWNVAQGGRFDNVRWDDWPLQAVRKSVEAFNLSSLDFGGVDVMVDTEGNSYIIEINSAPSLPMNEDGTPTYRQECMAKCFIHILNSGSKDRIPLTTERGGYRKFIHPAICDRAVVI